MPGATSEAPSVDTDDVGEPERIMRAERSRLRRVAAALVADLLGARVASVDEARPLGDDIDRLVGALDDLG